MGRKRKTHITLTVDDDVAEFISKHGHHRTSDFAEGKVNVSKEFNEFIRMLMAKIAPQTLGYALAREKEEHRVAMEQIDRRAKELFGASTIEEWLAREKVREVGETLVAEEQLSIREEIKAEVFDDLFAAFSKYQGRKPTRRQSISWLRSRSHMDSLRTLGITPEEFLARAERRLRPHEPEVG